jgi:type I restriction enzyme, S subunit
MSPQKVLLNRLIEPAPLERAGNRKLPILSMTMHEGLIDQASKFKKRVASVDTAGYKLVRRNQLVVGFPIDEGVLSFQDLYDEAIVSPAYNTWSLRKYFEIEPAYLERFLRSPRALAFYRVKLRGTTARRRTLPDDIFLQVEVPLPSLSEQRRIAEILDRADLLVAQRRESIRHFDTLTSSIFLDPATNPKGWPVGVVGDLLVSASYGTSEKAAASGAFPVLRMNNITRSGEVDLTELKYMDLEESQHDRYLVRPGDVLFNRTNSAELVGKTAIFRQARPMAYAGYLIRLRVNRTNDSEYLAAFLNTTYAKRVLRRMCKSIIGMANINATELQSIRILQPALRVQREFACRILAVERQKNEHRSSLMQLNALFRSLQYRAFRGEL